MAIRNLQAEFVGFFPKITHPRPEWLRNDAVQEICSVSNCTSNGPEDWINYWKHNELGFYDSEQLAYEVIEGNSPAFHLYAYKMYPFNCLNGESESISIPSSGIGVPDNYELLGYDIVSNSTGNFFECSPLSCNGGADEYPVNRYCLIPGIVVAFEVLSAICEKGNYEPGPYYLFEVYRKQLT